MESCKYCAKKIGANESFSYDGKCYSCHKKQEHEDSVKIDKDIEEEFGEAEIESVGDGDDSGSFSDDDVAGIDDDDDDSYF